MAGFAQPSLILFFPGIELEHRIDGHHLYAGFGVMRCLVYTGEHFLRGVGRGSVTVTQRIPHQIAGPVHQPVVHTPRVDADAFHIGILGRSTAQPLFHLLEQGREVPVHMSAQPYLPVGEAMQFVQSQLPAGHAPGYHPSASGSEIHSQERTHGFLPNI